MDEFYNSDSDFKDYVNKYARTYRIPVSVALTHELVRLAYLEYKERRNNE